MISIIRFVRNIHTRSRTHAHAHTLINYVYSGAINYIKTQLVQRLSAVATYFANCCPPPPFVLSRSVAATHFFAQKAGASAY